MIFWQIDAILKKYDCELKTAIKDVPTDAFDEILYGSMERVKIAKELVHTSSDFFSTYDGLIKYLKSVMDNDDSASS